MLIHGTISEIPLKWAWVSSCKLRREMEHRTLASYLAGQAYLSFTYAAHWVQSLVATLSKLHHSLLQLTSSRLPWAELSSTLRWIIKTQDLRTRGAKGRKESPCRRQGAGAVSFNLHPIIPCFPAPYTSHLSTRACNFITLSCSLHRVGIILQGSVNGLDKW